ncbi:MAG: alkaline phosphatase [Frankiales bacterium]|nr:alkaline phosphatase [Frankiales bacterium]
MNRTPLRATVMTVACTALVGAVAPAALAQSAPASPVTNVIYLLGDGMGVTHINAARQRYAGAAGRLEMEKADATGKVSTYAVEEGTSTPALVTDSASAATAWSSGVKTYNAALGVDAHAKRVETLMEQAKKAGMRTGDVSTAEITDATPAAMVSHVLLRGCQGPVYSDAACLGTTADGKPRPVPADPTLITPVAEQIARNGTADVILGGGLARFEPDDAKALTDQGYTVLGGYGDPALAPGQQTAQTQRVATRTDLQGVSSDKVIGLFNRGNMTVETTKAATSTAVAQEPSLAEMTTKAISLLDGKTPKGFLLQVEGALIDKRSHANDAAQTLGEMKAFDDAVKAATAFAKKDGHTLVLTTADHECAGFNIVEKGTFTNAEAKNFPGTGNTDAGNPANNSATVRSGSQTKDAARSTGANNAPGAAVGNFAPAYFRTADDPADLPDGDPRDSLWLTYLSGNHTGADVNVFATGPGAQRFAGSQDNTDLYRKMFDSLASLGDVRPSASASPTPTQAPAKKPLTFRTIVQGRGNGRVLVALNDVASAQPGARVDLYYVDRGVQRFARRLTLTAAGRTTTTPATFTFPRGTSPTFVVRVHPVDGVSAVTTSSPFTGYAG